MAFSIVMTKIKKENFIHYYIIETIDYEYQKPLVAGLDSKNKKILFFINNDIQTPIYTIDLQNLPDSFENNYLPASLVYKIFKKMKQAIDKQEYDNCLHYAA